MMQVQHSFLPPGRFARLLTVLSLFVLAMALSADALAASRNFVVESGARRPAARLALVIGNDYAGESGRLENPLNDANDMRQALAKLGFEVMGDDQQGLEDMTRLVREFGDRLRPGMVGLFYFAGHGMQINGQNYLIPERSGIQREDEVPFRALAVDQVLAKMGHNQTGLNLLMLDACRDNPFARSFRGNTTGLARMNAPSGTLIAYAAKPGTRSKDGSGRNGLYTGVLLKYLPIPGLPIEQMLKKVGAEVRQRSGDSQQTWMEGLLDSGDGGDFCFAGCGATPTPSTPPYRPVVPVPEPAPLPTQVTPKPESRPIPKRKPIGSVVTPAPLPAPTPKVPQPSRIDDDSHKLLAIGQTYQGGIIFYLDNSGRHGLIAAPSDQSAGIQWYNGNLVTTGATRTAGSMGKANTNKIIAVQGVGNYAASLAASLVLNGYRDWFLPSKDELKLMYQNIGPGAPMPLTNIGGFSSNFYWSSSENSHYHAWDQEFDLGIQHYGYKDAMCAVRAVRAF